MNIRPPNAESSWDNCNVETQATLIAFNQIRELEEFEELKTMVKSR